VRGSSDPIASSGGWTAGETYTLKIVRYDTPFTTSYHLRFAGDQLVVDSEQNVGPADARVSHLVGTIEPAGTHKVSG
jgi:hypothetical protein